jgi:hypothetical protein
MFSVSQPSVNKLNVIQLSVSPLNVVLLSGIVSSVVLLNVVAPIRSLRLSKTLTIKPVFLVPFFFRTVGRFRPSDARGSHRCSFVPDFFVR